jgi:hypothetical protein
VFAGVIPVIGPLFAAGPIASALGLTGAVGAAAAGGMTGAAAGGMLAALVRLGVSEEHAQRYADAAHTDDSGEVAAALEEAGATDVESYRPAV